MRPALLYDYRRHLGRYVLADPLIADLPLADLRPMDVQLLQARDRIVGLSGRGWCRSRTRSAGACCTAERRPQAIGHRLRHRETGTESEDVRPGLGPASNVNGFVLLHVPDLPWLYRKRETSLESQVSHGSEHP